MIIYRVKKKIYILYSQTALLCLGKEKKANEMFITGMALIIGKLNPSKPIAHWQQRHQDMFCHCYYCCCCYLDSHYFCWCCYCCWCLLLSQPLLMLLLLPMLKLLPSQQLFMLEPALIFQRQLHISVPAAAAAAAAALNKSPILITKVARQIW